MRRVSIKTYDTYLFDLDGTLTDTAFVWLDVFRDCLAELGIAELSYSAIAQHTHDWDEFLKLGVPPEKLRTFIDTAKTQANSRLCEAPMYDGAHNLLSKLKRGSKNIGLFTSMERALLEPIIERHGLGSLLGVIVAGSDVKRVKPDPEGIFKALNMLGAEKSLSSAVYIGDKETDIQADKNAGIDSILFFPPEHHALYDQASLKAMHPTAIIESFEELRVNL